MAKHELEQLEQQVAHLLDLYTNAQEENSKLRSQFVKLKSEHERLKEHKDMASSKIESMIERLKALELSGDFE